MCRSCASPCEKDRMHLWPHVRVLCQQRQAGRPEVRRTVFRAGGGRVLQVFGDREKNAVRHTGRQPARAGIRARGAGGRVRLRSCSRSRAASWPTTTCSTACIEQVIEQYAYPGNYLILVYHDVYDVRPGRPPARRRRSPRRSTSTYCARCVRSSCPSPRSVIGRKRTRIGARVRDWVVGLPDLGFVYPAFSGRGSDVNAVLYYVKTGRGSHPELIESVLGCVSQRTATEEKKAFQSVVKSAFGEDEEQAEAAFFRIQKTISGMVAEQEADDSLPPVGLTAQRRSRISRRRPRCRSRSGNRSARLSRRRSDVYVRVLRSVTYC